MRDIEFDQSRITIINRTTGDIITIRFCNRERLEFQINVTAYEEGVFVHSGNSTLFKAIQQKVAKALHVDINDKMVAYQSLPGFAGCSIVLYNISDNNYINSFLALDVISRHFLHSPEWSIENINCPTRLHHYLRFEYLRLHLWKKANEVSMDEQGNLLDSLSKTYTYLLHPQQQKELARTNFFIENFQDETDTLSYFFESYIESLPQVSPHGILQLLKQLLNSGLFSEKTIKTVLSESYLGKTYGQWFFDLDSFQAIQLHESLNLKMESPDYHPDLFEIIIHWIVETFGAVIAIISLFQWEVSLFKTHSGVETAISLLNNGDKTGALQLKNLAVTEKNPNLRAKACYHLAKTSLDEYKKNPFSCYDSEAVEWVKRGALFDDGKQFGRLINDIKSLLTPIDLNEFILQCACQSSIVSLNLLDNTSFFPIREKIESSIFSLLKYTVWSDETAVQAVDKLAKLLQRGIIAPSSIEGNSLYNCFYQFPPACLRILTNPLLMKYICMNSLPEDIGKFLLESADLVTQAIESGDKDSGEYFSTFSNYMESIDLTEYNKRCNGLHSLGSRYEEIKRVAKEQGLLAELKAGI